MKERFTPKEIVKELNKYIISQDDAKRYVAISLRNRYRRKNVENELLRKEITPKNIILMGPTGVGKTEIARRLAKVTNSPFIKVEATKFTEVGYVGKDVESMIKDLVNVTFMMLKNEELDKLEDQCLEIVYEKIAKKLNEFVINEDDKEKLIDDIANGKYDDKEIEIEKAPKVAGPVIEVFGSGDDDNIQGLLDNLISSIPSAIGKQNKVTTVKVTVEEAIQSMLRDEVEKSFDIEALIPRVIEKVEDDGIIFIDEIDKIAERNGLGKGDVSREGVQRDILPIIEGTTVMTKYGPVKTDHILFIAAGAFSQSSPSDLMPELQGRFPVKVKLESLTLEDFVKILTKVDNNLIKQYQAMLEIDNVILEFTNSAIKQISEIAIMLNKNLENIGARRLHSVLETLLRDIMYDAPFAKNKVIKIDKNSVKKHFTISDKKENLNNYIL